MRNLDLVAPVIDDSLAAGATSLDSVTLRVSDPTSGERQARLAAVADARRKADTLVGAAGTRITGVITISESVSTPPWPWRSEALSDTGGTPILPGLSELVVTVTVVYGLE